MIINTAGIEPGEYSLVLESFDEASNGVESALKTDTITIVILEPEPLATLAIFTDDLETAFVLSGTKSSWILPDINPGVVELAEVRLDADPLILQHLKYDSLANSIIYDGKAIGALTTLKLVNLDITLVNSIGENSYTQLVTVSPNLDPLLPSEPEEGKDEEDAKAETVSEEEPEAE